ncbi:MAG TPA: hypothetical protein VNF47_15935 [Streptosporangiaceae bacterium]|nr:hypothetical protein [Streptosporangiaceae bacterium]
MGKYVGNPAAGFTSHLSTPLADVTLLAIALGAVCANALNVYSGSMSFLALPRVQPVGRLRGDGGRHGGVDLLLREEKTSGGVTSRPPWRGRRRRVVVPDAVASGGARDRGHA